MRSFTLPRQRVIVVVSILTFLVSASDELNDNPTSTKSSTDVITHHGDQTDDVTSPTLPLDNKGSTSSIKRGRNISRDASENVIWETNEDENCSNSQGWNLKGSDWGCCGNYVGCCTYASIVCYIHDAMCRCCDVRGNFCGPKCRPESECYAKNDANAVTSVSYENFWSNSKNSEKGDSKYDVITTSSYDTIDGSGETVFHAVGPD